MIMTLIRLVTLMAIVGAVAFGFYWLSGLEGEVLFRFGEREIPVSLLNAVIALIVLMVAFWIFIELVRFGLAVISFMMGDKNAFSRYLRRRANRKGMNSLSLAVESLATGNGRAALSNAYKADRYLEQPVLTGLLVAQSAKAADRPKEAEAAYRKVLESGKGRFAAIRGLMHDKLVAGDKQKALKLAEKAIALKPNDIETVNALFELQVDEKDWEGARKTLRSKTKLEKLPSDFVSRREAVMALCEAKAVDQDAEKERYSDRVMLSNRLAPNLVPAAVLAAKTKAEAGDVRGADRVLVKAWNAEPHPDISKAYAELSPNETPEERLKRFRVLTKRQSKHPETRMLLAELLLAVEDFPGARRALGDVEELSETSRSLSILAAIEHGEGADSAIVRAYLARAANASRGPQWVCNHCGHVHSEWVSDCINCERFDTLDWKLPPEAKDDHRGLGVLMPLLDVDKSESKDQEAKDIEKSEIVEATVIEDA